VRSGLRVPRWWPSAAVRLQLTLCPQAKLPPLQTALLGRIAQRAGAGLPELDRELV